MTYNPKDRRWRVALHEAGHAVIAEHHDIEVSHAVINGDGSGYCQYARVEKRLVAYLVASCAGREAEAVIGGYPADGTDSGDRQQIGDRIETYGWDEAARFSAREEARQLVGRFEKAVRHVALILDRDGRIEGLTVRDVLHLHRGF